MTFSDPGWMSAAWLRRHRRRLEWVLALALVLALAAVALQRLLILTVEAERLAVELTLGNVRSTLRLQLAEHLIGGSTAELAQAAGRNPVGWVIDAPRGYIGIWDDAQAEQVAPGSWYFDPGMGALVYRVVNADYLDTDLPGAPRLRWRVEPSFEDADGDGRYTPGTDRLWGLELRPLEPYVWRPAARGR